MIGVGEKLPGMNFHELAQVESRSFHAKTLILISVTATMIILTLLAPSFLWLLPSFVLGLAYAHAVELQHQCLHHTAYRGIVWNRIVGVILGLPLLVSYSDYQNSHMKHHKLLGTPEDKEFFNYSYQRLTSVLAFIPHLWMVRHYRDTLIYICKSVAGRLVREKDATLKAAKKIRSEYQLMALFIAAIVVAAFFFHIDLVLKLWLMPLLIGIPTHALIELPEHIGCNVRTTNVLENTRTIKASKIANWFVNGNNYHVEHHWLPGVPNNKFSQLHTCVASRITNFDESYWSFYQEFFRNLRNQNLHNAWKKETKALSAAAK
jgi:fatty acid desaturase